MKKPLIDGFSKSAWKSLAVKALRIGWVDGLKRSEAALGKSDLKLVLTCGVFEDIFPAVTELPDVMQDIRTLNYDNLCRRQTHHGRPGLTARFCELEPLAVEQANNHKPELWAAGKAHHIWLPLRSLNCWWTWLEMAPTDKGKTRRLDRTPWQGMPPAMIDSHTMEGKIRKVGATILSGHYHKHLELSVLVQDHGWEHIREIVHGAPRTERARNLETGELFQKQAALL